jgi:iron-sulfur cluster insertion protein
MTTGPNPQDGDQAGGLKKLKVLPGASPAPALSVTEAAVRKIREYRGAHEEHADKAFRVRVDGGGCAGFRYAFEFDDARDDDLCVESGDVTIVVDPMSVGFLRGSTLDFYESLMTSGFVVTNPNSSSTCGCGHSFGV